ncbi:MAG: iron chelate uptake ABC transporter family permease subunit, partial [bacterium]|nr:iron chelate uptake ABC transporter family permease subunit [bacterium]
MSLPFAGALMIYLGFLSLRYGVLHIDVATVWDAVWNYDRSDQGQVVVRELRVPRTVIGMLAGAGFAVAGALTQGVTRNPLGAPGILGTNAGAAFAVVTAIYSAGITTPAGYVWFAFAGALGATVLVYLVASAGVGGPTPVKLALAGAVISALLGSWTAALLLLDLETLDQARFWL